jgi:peptide/nickel transport system substrate-binding protein
MVAKGVMLPGENVTGLFSSANAATGGIDYVAVGLKDPEKG